MLPDCNCDLISWTFIYLPSAKVIFKKGIKFLNTISLTANENGNYTCYAYQLKQLLTAG